MTARKSKGSFLPSINIGSGSLEGISSDIKTERSCFQMKGSPNGPGLISHVKSVGHTSRTGEIGNE
jgi:hypothetical protein